MKIGILGAGAGGTAVAQVLALAGHDVMVWDRNTAVITDISKRNENRKYFPGFVLADTIIATGVLEQVLDESDVIFIALPIRAQTEVAAAALPFLKDDHIIVHIAAGVRETDGAFVTDMWEEVTGKTLKQAVIAGPNFALEVMQEKFTAQVVAARDEEVAEKVANLFDVPFIRCYSSTDVVGVQIAAAVRNVLAIAAGMCEGLGLGMNAQAAVLCRGLGEMLRLAEALGADGKTVMGLAGMGDLILHAGSKLSRNYRFGVQLGRGLTVEQAEESIGKVEGMRTAKIIAYLCSSNGVDLAIVTAVDGILNGDLAPKQAFEYLVQRPTQEEF